jgi:hypothetical protein
MVELLYKHRGGRCRAFEAEVPPDHALAQLHQLLGLGSLVESGEPISNRLLGAMACSYLQLPSEELSARLMPEEERLRSLGGKFQRAG